MQIYEFHISKINTSKFFCYHFVQVHLSDDGSRSKPLAQFSPRLSHFSRWIFQLRLLFGFLSWKRKFVLLALFFLLFHIWTCTDYSFSFQRAKTGWILEEKSVFSFRWRGEKWSDIRGSHLVSTEYRCLNRSRWRAHLRSAGLSLGLVSAMNSVVVGKLAKCILRQLSIAYFHIRV